MSEQQDPWAEYPASSVSAVPAGEKGKDWEGYPEANATTGEKMKAFGQSAMGSLIEMSPVIPGMVMGAEIGALGGPFAPVTVPAGAIIGAGAGWMFGKGARELASEAPLNPFDQSPLANRGPESVTPGTEPYAYAGEVIGGSAPFAAGPIVAARTGARLPPSMVGNFLNRIVDMAERAPGSFSVSEAAAAAGSAVAAALSESFAPGNKGLRTAAEIGGGFFNPTRLIAGTSHMAIDGAKAVFRSMSDAGRETRAAKILQDVLLEHGEDPETVARLLAEPGVTGLTAAQKSGSPGLAALEADLINSSARFGADAKKGAETGMEAVKKLIFMLRGTGDPAAFRAAAEIQQRHFRSLMVGKVQQAEESAIAAAKRLSKDPVGAKAEIARVADEALTKSLSEARAAESELWAVVPKGAPAKPSSLLEAETVLRGEVLPEEQATLLPKIAADFLTRMKSGQATTGDLILFRSRALTLARDAARGANPDYNAARVYGRLAEAALDDLDAAFKAVGDVSYDTARAFSRELHDTFTRTFAGTALSTGARGADRVPPELLLKQALGTGKEVGDLRLKELADATNFLPSKGEGSPENFNIMMDAQERILRIAASEAVDPQTGRISATSLARFARNNEKLLERFPEVKSSIDAALKGETALTDIQLLAKNATRIADRQAAFAKIAKVESPADAIKTAVDGKNPVQDLTGFARVAKKGGPEAVEGLKAAVLDHAIREAATGGGWSVAKMRTAFFAALKPGQPSIAKLMERSGVMTPDDLGKLDGLLKQAEKIESALKGGDTNALQDAPDFLMDLVARMTGSHLATRLIGGGNTGTSLIAAQRGSAFMRQVMMKIPFNRTKDVLIQAASDPDFMALLLMKPRTEVEGTRLARQVHAYLIRTGIVSSEDSGESPS